MGLPIRTRGACTQRCSSDPVVQVAKMAIVIHTYQSPSATTCSSFPRPAWSRVRRAVDVGKHGLGRAKRSIVKAHAAERSRRKLMRSPHVPNMTMETRGIYSEEFGAVVA